jgi:Fe-S-cluster containining protein
MSDSSKKWYNDGLHFSCTECGNCCTGPPGYVWVSQEEIQMLSEFIGRKDGKLPDDQLRQVGARFSLTERENGDCTFLQHLPNGQRVCRVYPVRPLQCRTWPFWNSNLQSQRSWDQAGRMCPGINRGQLHTYEEIERQRTKKQWW